MVCMVTRRDGPCESLAITASPLLGRVKVQRLLILRTIIKEQTMDRKNGLPPIHPGEILREDVLPEVGLSVTAAAKALGASRQMLHEILAERRPLTAIMCLKVSRLLVEFDLKKAAQYKKIMERVAQIVPVKSQVDIHV